MFNACAAAFPLNFTPRMIDDRETPPQRRPAKLESLYPAILILPLLPARAHHSTWRNMHFFPVVCTPSTVMRLRSRRAGIQRRSTILLAPARVSIYSLFNRIVGSIGRNFRDSRRRAPDALLFRDRSFSAPRCPRFRCSAPDGDYI